MKQNNTTTEQPPAYYKFIDDYVEFSIGEALCIPHSNELWYTSICPNQRLNSKELKIRLWHFRKDPITLYNRERVSNISDPSSRL